MDIKDTLVAIARTQRETDDRSILLDDYLDVVRDNPLVAGTAVERLYEMVLQAGVSPGRAPRPATYDFFASDLYGIDDTLDRIVGYLRSAAQRHETRRRILTLYGPPGGAKSTIAALLKRGYERFTHTDRGAIYALEGCPMHEEPLHLVPDASDDVQPREQLAAQLGVQVEGGLCPLCAYRLRTEYGGDFTRFPIRRVVASEAGRVAIATFEPSDPKSMSMEQLTGGLNFRKIEEHGDDSHPEALDWAGEFSKANRGLFEAVEFFKSPREFLYAFLSLAQERQFKVPKFGYIGADVFVLAHTNESEFRGFLSDQRNEALRDRLFTIAVPYNLRVGEERRIYGKLLAPAQRRGDFHVAPHSLDVASMLAVLSRLKPYERLGRLEKLKLYDGEEVGEWKLAQVPEIQRAADGEGMTGLGPRAIVNVLASAASEPDPGREGARPCLHPIKTLVALKQHLEQAELGRDERDALRDLVTDIRTELDRTLRDEVRRAFIPAFAEQAQGLLENYLNNVEAFLQDVKLRDPVSHEEREPDEAVMRAVEDQVGVADSARQTFREGVLVRIGIQLRKGRPLTYRSDDQLGRAIEGYLFEQMKDIVRITVSKTNPDPEQARRLNEVLRVMVEQRGYCDTCATAVLDYVGALLNR